MDHVVLAEEWQRILAAAEVKQDGEDDAQPQKPADEVPDVHQFNIASGIQNAKGDVPDEMLRALASLSEDSKKMVLQAEKDAEFDTRTYIYLITLTKDNGDLKTIKELAKEVAECPFKDIAGNPAEGKYKLALLSHQLCGESRQSPEYRYPTLRQTLIKQFIQAVHLGLRGTTNEILVDLVWAIFDGGIPGNHDIMRKCFMSEAGEKLDKEEDIMNLMISQEALEKQREIGKATPTSSIGFQRGTKYQDQADLHHEGGTAGDSLMNIGTYRHRRMSETNKNNT